MNDKLYYLIIVASALLAAGILSFVVRKLLNLFIAGRSKLLRADPTNFSFIKNSVSIVIFTVALIYIFLQIPALKSFGTALFAGAGIIAAFVGFAAQKAFSNIITGVFILIFKPFRVEDLIKFSNDLGIVEEITLRHTVVKDFENRRIIVPNSIISDQVILNSNITDERIRRHLPLVITYESDMEKAMQIMQQEAEKHPNCIDARTPEDKGKDEPIVSVIVTDLNSQGVHLRANVWSEDGEKSFKLKCDILKSIKKRFDQEGIELAYPHTVLKHTN